VTALQPRVIQMAYSVGAALLLLFLLKALGLRLPPLLKAWQTITPDILLELHEVGYV